MARRDTFYGAYDISLEEELLKHQKKLKDLGIQKATKMEASLLIAQKAKRSKLSTVDIKKIIRRKRGLL